MRDATCVHVQLLIELPRELLTACTSQLTIYATMQQYIQICLSFKCLLGQQIDERSILCTRGGLFVGDHIKNVGVKP